MAEEKVVKPVTMWLKRRGFEYFVNHGNMYGPKGQPDIHGYAKGWGGFSIEVKAGNGYPLKSNQLIKLIGISINDGIAIVAYPDFMDYENFDEIPIIQITKPKKNDPLSLYNDQQYNDQLEAINKDKKTKRLVVV